MSGRHESWEFDSGARDLSPEPHTLQKLVEAAAGGTGNMLDLANKVKTIQKLAHTEYFPLEIRNLTTLSLDFGKGIPEKVYSPPKVSLLTCAHHRRTFPTFMPSQEGYF